MGQTTSSQAPAASAPRVPRPKQRNPDHRGDVCDACQLVRVGARSRAEAVLAPQLSDRPHPAEQQEPSHRVAERSRTSAGAHRETATTTAPVNTSDRAPYALRTMTSIPSSTAVPAHAGTHKDCGSGATGRVGRHVVDVLKAGGHDVV